MKIEMNDNAAAVLIVFIIAAAATLIIFLASGCDDGCIRMETECTDNKIMICDDEQNWSLLMNCNDVASFIDGGPSEWQCCLNEEGEHRCLPPEECRE